jgi:hypothetical protein
MIAQCSQWLTARNILCRLEQFGGYLALGTAGFLVG